LTSVAERRSVQIELMRSILPTGLPSNYQGRPPMLPAVAVNTEPFMPMEPPSLFWLGEKSGTTLLAVRQSACEGRKS
jgi:hypothetical protein